MASYPRRRPLKTLSIRYKVFPCNSRVARCFTAQLDVHRLDSPPNLNSGSPRQLRLLPTSLVDLPTGMLSAPLRPSSAQILTHHRNVYSNCPHQRHLVTTNSPDNDNVVTCSSTVSDCPDRPHAGRHTRPAPSIRRRLRQPELLL